MPLGLRLNEGLGRSLVLGLRPIEVRSREHQRNKQLWHEIAQPESMRFGQADLTHRQQPPTASDEDTGRDEVDESALLPNGDSGPGANDTHEQVDACHEAMDVVQPRGRFGLTKIHLERAAKDGDRRECEETDPNNNLTGGEGCFHGDARVVVMN